MKNAAGGIIWERIWEQCLQDQLDFCVANPVARAVHMNMCWLPSSYEEWSYAATIVAIVLGGCWAVYTWRHQWVLRRDPGIEMEILFSETSMPLGKVLLKIDVVANNTSDVSIWPKINKTSISIARVNAPEASGFLRDDSSEGKLETKYILPDLEEMRLEPHTKTVFSEFYLAEMGALYEIASIQWT